MSKRFKYIFGPVPSRRLGLSLGIDLVPHKVCSYDCVYCECGRTTLKTLNRDEYIPRKEILKELTEFASSPLYCDYITFSGSGEPTLNIAFGDIARWVKDNLDRPLALLTNSSLFVYQQVRREAALCDLVLPSLDAVSDEIFRRINRPCSGITARDVVRGLAVFRKEYPEVEMALEILFVRGVNDSDREVKLLKEAVEYIEPHQVHLNTVDRPPADDVDPVSEEFLRQVRDFMGEKAVIVGAGLSSCSLEHERLKEAILGTIARRPLRISDIARLVGEDDRCVSKVLEILKREGAVEEVRFHGKTFFVGRA